MSAAVEVTIHRLLAVPAVTDIVGQDINPDTATAADPAIAVRLVSDSPWEALARSSGTSEARVTISLLSRNALVISNLGEAVVRGLNRVKADVGGRACSWRKAGTDFTRWSDDASTNERLMDWIVTYRDEPV